MSSVVIQYAENVVVPAWVIDLPSFHRWAGSEDIPEFGRIDFLAGEVWIDQSAEQLFSHNQVRGAFVNGLAGIARGEQCGRFFTSGIRVSHVAADWSVIPDGTYILNDTFRARRAVLIEGPDGDHVRVEGSPDMVLEVVSTSSVGKDTKRLRQLYWDAGIPEYWLVDARNEPLTFDLLKRTATGYIPTRKQGGWLKSAVFGRSFRLLQEADELGHPTFTLEVR